MREFLDCLRTCEFFKDSVIFSLGMRGTILPFFHMPSLECTDSFTQPYLTSIFFTFTTQNTFTLTPAICVRYLSSCEVHSSGKLRGFYNSLTELSILESRLLKYVKFPEYLRPKLLNLKNAIKVVSWLLNSFPI
jgi:hypothetical protein